MHTFLVKSPATLNTPADQARRTTATKLRLSVLAETLRDTWLSTAVLCLMAATLLALFWFPLARTFANVEVNYNEGWNAYRAAMIARRIPLYGMPPHGFGTATAYPPLSFH